MRTILFFTTIFAAFSSIAQLTATFETPALSGPDEAWYGQDQVTDGDTIYDNDSYIMELSYDAGWGSFSGWSVSNWSDVTTPGWANQFSAITGAAQEGDQYGVCYVTPWTNNRLFKDLSGADIPFGMYVTNTTYAYYSMLEGDSFAKKFGEDTSATGVIDGTNGEDWFLLTIYGLNADSTYNGDSVNFYLADYRFEDDADDYIIDEWTWVGLSSLYGSYGFDFVLSSSDTVGGFGMNTPAYFAADEIRALILGLDEEEESVTVYPNPFTGVISLNLSQSAEVEIFDMSGRRVYGEMIEEGTNQLDLNHLTPGMYNLIARFDDHVLQERIIKE